MKTALQELIEYFERQIENCKGLNMPLEEWAFKCSLKETRERLKKEKEVIEKVFDDGYRDGLKSNGIAYKSEYETFEDYYNQTFND